MVVISLYPWDCISETWSPGYALSLNTQDSRSQFAYTFPRTVGRRITIEFWTLGSGIMSADDDAKPTTYYFSVASSKHDNTIYMSYNELVVYGEIVMTFQGCSEKEWCHQAWTIDVSAFPLYSVKYYQNGELLNSKDSTHGFEATGGNIFNDKELSIVLGAEQDALLGNWDASQIFAGHIDEFRMWNTIRSPAEIAADHRRTIPPSSPGLMMYYTFDDAPGTTCFADRTSSNPQHCLRLGDWSVEARTPTMEPAYAPPAEAWDAQAVSTAPVCGLAGHSTLLVEPRKAVPIPLPSLYCGPGEAFTVTVHAVHGGAVEMDGASALGRPLAPAAPLRYVAGGTADVPVAVNYSVQVPGRPPVEGSIGVVPNRPPRLSAVVQVFGREDTPTVQWVPAMDPDNDIVFLDILELPPTGTAALDALLQRLVLYTGPPHVFGMNLTQFLLRARDVWGAVSPPSLAKVSLEPTTDTPKLNLRPNFTIYQGQALPIPFTVTDVDNTDPVMLVEVCAVGARV